MWETVVFPDVPSVKIATGVTVVSDTGPEGLGVQSENKFGPNIVIFPPQQSDVKSLPNDFNTLYNPVIIPVPIMEVES